MCCSSPAPSKFEQEASLVDAFVDIIWKASLPLNKQKTNDKTTEKKQAVVTLVGQDPCFKTKGYFVEDGFTEKV